MTAESEQDAVRRRVVYAGRVQGVCFRMTAVELSRPYEVVGYVRNLPDGSVELEAEGQPTEVDAFLADVQRHFSRNIREAQHSEQPACGKEAGFQIRY